MLNIIPPVKYRPRRRARKGSPRALPALTAPVLVSAQYYPGYVTLRFDRAIDMSGLDATEFVVLDGDYIQSRCVVDGEPVLVDPTTVELPLVGIYEDVPPGIHLNVGSGNGIVTEGTTLEWAGVVELVLPFG